MYLIHYHYLLQILFSFLISSSLPVWAGSEQAQEQEQAQAQAQAIQAPVNQLHESLINIMKSADSTPYQQRYDLLEKTIIKNFNTALISRVVLSRYWKSLNEQKKLDFIALFNDLTIATYIDRFDSFNEHAFKHLSIEPMQKNRFMVKTELLLANDEPVSFDYIVQNQGGQWKIISVIANGVNDLSLKRAEYSAVIKEHGFDRLVISLKKKSKTYSLNNINP